MADVSLTLTTVSCSVNYIHKLRPYADYPALRVNGLIQYRAGGKLKPGVVTPVAGNQIVNLRIGRSGGTVSSVPKWKRSTPATAGWVR